MTDDKTALLEQLASAEASWHLFSQFDRNEISSQIGRARPDGPLSGVVVGLKDNMAVAGARCTAGMAHRRDRHMRTDAHVAARLHAAGAVLIPGLNMDEAALGGATDNSHFGRTRNPHAPDRLAGGSSGGAAAAVACGCVTIALGSDTLGSIRIPASYCGVVGLKPTAGLIGRSGVVPLAPGFDTVGPIARHARDIWPMLSSLSGHDPCDEDSLQPPHSWDQPPLERPLRIAVPAEIGSVACTPPVRSAFEKAEDALRSLGHEVCTVNVPGWSPDGLRRAAFLITEWEASVALAAELKEGAGISRIVREMISYGAVAGADKLVPAIRMMRRARNGLARVFEDCDVILTPTTPQTAPLVSDGAPSNQADFTALANVAGTPALAVPVGVGIGACPASVQLIGPAWSERLLLQLAERLEEALARRTAPG